MRLQSTFFLALVLANDSSLSAASDPTVPDDKKMVPNSNSTVASSNPNDKKTTLPSRTTTDDEERVAGANLFTKEKIELADLDNAFKNKLFERWARHQKTDKHVTHLVKKQVPGAEKKLLEDYNAWIQVHKPHTDKNVVDKVNMEMINEAIDNPMYKSELYKFFKLHGIEPKQLRAKVSPWEKNNEKVTKFYTGYYKWLRLHHPDIDKPRMEAVPFYFEKSRLERAAANINYAYWLFTKWNPDKYRYSVGLIRKNMAMNSEGVDKKVIEAVATRYEDWYNKFIKPKKLGTFTDDFKNHLRQVAKDAKETPQAK